MSKIKKTLRRPESFCLIVTIILFLFIQIQSGQFFTVNNLTDLLAAYIVPGIMALGSLVVFISGGLDVSFAWKAFWNHMAMMLSNNLTNFFQFFTYCKIRTNLPYYFSSFFAEINQLLLHYSPFCHCGLKL